jgi:transcriptional regulator with XRE-family HTH domain
MGKSLKVCHKYLERVKLALRRSGYARQKDLAEEIGMSLSTVSNYFTGRPISVVNFMEISDRLNLDWRSFCDLDTDASEPPVAIANNEESFIYVNRPPVETICYEALLKPNALVRIKAPGLMGKTALVAKTLKQLDKLDNCRTVYLNLHFADSTDFSNLNQFLRWFCTCVGQSLGFPNQLAERWDENYSTPKMNCDSYIEKNFLPSSKNALVLCLDEVDRIFPYQELASEFLGLLRAWHEKAKTQENWRKLRLVIVHSTEIYTPLNINESPFNVGLNIDLPEFTLEQIQELSHLHGLDWTKEQANQLMEKVGGHPYLVEQAFSHLKNNPGANLSDLFQTAADAGIYRNHLRHLGCMLDKCPALIAAMSEVVNANYPVHLKSEQSAYQLVSMGVVHFEGGNRIVPRCNLYREYFRDRITNAPYWNQPISPANYQVGGSLPLDAPSYVTRPADEELYLLLRSGEFCYVLNSRQMGKSSLKVRLMQRLQAEGIACADIDLTLIGTQQISPQQWYGRKSQQS